MKKFRFKLEPALTLRRHEKNEAARALAQASEQCRLVHERMERARADLSLAEATLHPAPGERMLVGEMTRRQSVLAHSREQVQRLGQQLQEASAQEDACRDRVLLARRREESIHRLRSQAVEGFRREQEREDELAVGEFVAARHRFKQF